MMDLTIRYTGGNRFEAECGGHALVSDQPLDNDGADTGAAPADLFLFSLGTCAGYYAARYLNARALPSEDLEVRVSARLGGMPVRFVSVGIEVVAPGLTKHHRDGVLRAVECCLITNTLIHPPEVDVRVVAGAARELAMAAGVF